MANTTWSTTDKTAGITLSGGNLVALNSAGGPQGGRAADRQRSGKYYWEVSYDTTGSAAAGAGVSIGTASNAYTNTGYVGACGLEKTNGVFVNGASVLNTFGAIANGALVCIALDIDNKRIWFRVGAAGNWNANASYNPATNAGGIDISVFGVNALYPCHGSALTNDQFTANFGDSAFSGAVPSGFTSGFPTGTPALIAAETQIALEEWAMPNAQAQLTQAALEMWGQTGAGPRLALLTQMALEMWAPPAVAAAVARQTAVTVSVS